LGKESWGGNRVSNTGSSPALNGILEALRKVRELTPETKYILCGPVVFKKFEEQARARGGYVTREYQIGRAAWFKAFDREWMKFIIHPMFEKDDNLFGCERIFFNSFLDTGKYDPETDSFDLKPIVE
jgi:hypothetical protein